MGKVDVVVYKMDSFGNDSFVEKVIRYSQKSVILIYDFDKITVRYKPPGVNLKRSSVDFRRFSNPNFVHYFSPFIFLLELITVARLFWSISWRYRPKTWWVENSYAALVSGILRKFRLCARSVYVSGDWVMTNNDKGILSRFANNKLFPVADYLACRFNDEVLNLVAEIADARYRFWGRKIARRERLRPYKIEIEASAANFNGNRNAICFVGNMREDCGLDIVIRSLARIRSRADIVLKIIGPKKQNYEYFRKLCQECGVEKHTEFFGFVEMEELGKTVNDCFCGVNLVTDMNTYSSYTIPGKIMHYLQFLLPVIASMGAGPFTSVIENEDLGMVIEPNENDFIDAVFKIHDAYPHYRDKIVQYADSMPDIDVREMIEG